MNEEDNSQWRGLDARTERLEDLTRELDELLRGSRRTKQTGLVADQERMELEVRKLNAVVFVDSTGKRGIAHDVDYLMDRRSGNDRREGFRWTFWGLILATLISSGTALLTNWDRIKNLLPKDHPGPLEMKIEKARRPRSPKKIFRLRVVPASDNGPTEEPKASEEP